jgi:carbon-monoxide dehydrogenase large subunit
MDRGPLGTPGVAAETPSAPIALSVPIASSASSEVRHRPAESLPRIKAKILAAGRGRYADDLRFPRLAHAAFLRSPYAHARIRRVDLAAVRAAPGVLAAYDGRAIGAVCRPWATRLATFPGHRCAAQPPLAVDRAVWQGQPAVIVVARSRALAEDALSRTDVEWEELEPIADPAGALRDGAAAIHPELGSNLAFEHRFDRGNALAVFESAARVVSRTFHFARHTGVTLETRSLVADYDPAARRLTVHASTQVPHQMRAVLADCLDVPEQDVRVVTPDVGGGFGIKLHCYDDEMAVCAAAMLLGRPVKYVCDRLEALQSDIHARGHRVSASLALDGDGRVLALQLDDCMEAGAYSVYPRSSILEGLHAVNFAGIVYGFDACAGRLRVAYQNKPGTASYRGVGQPIACAVTEFMMDAAAAELGTDPAEFRRRNFRGDMAAATVAPASIDGSGLSHAKCLDTLLELMGYAELRERQRAARAGGRLLGIGLASFVEQNAPGPAFYGNAQVKISAADGCTLRLEPSGAFTCITSNTDQGQGVESTLGQLLAGHFGVPASRVRIAAGDTVVTPVGGGTFASRGLVSCGEAALAAALELTAHLRAAAAALWDVPLDAVRLDADAVRSDGGRRLTLAELGDVLHYKRHLLPAGAAVGADVTVQTSVKQPYLLANGVQASFVEVDRDTGIVRLLGHWVVEDCGRLVNPLLADEQLRGGVVQGLGAALFEECRYNERAQLLSGTLADYLVPMAAELPDIVIAHVETPVPDCLLGSKGIGEAGTIGAGAAVGNAINDALRPLGCAIDEQPYTPERILQVLGSLA